MKKKPSAEDEFAVQLDFAGYRYEREFKFAKPVRLWRADFHLIDYELIVEIEGIGYGTRMGRHQVGQSYQSDCEKYNEMILRRFALLRFTPQMVRGKAKRMTKNKEPMASAIEVVDRFVFGEKSKKIDKTIPGYARLAKIGLPHDGATIYAKR